MDRELRIVLDNINTMIEEGIKEEQYNKSSLESIRARLDALSKYSGNLLENYSTSNDPKVKEYLTARLFEANTEIIFVSIYSFTKLIKILNEGKP